LDEPLAALGPAMRQEIIDLLKELVETEKMYALLISHQPEDALKASARTAFINQGKILVIDESEKLLRHSEIPVIKHYLGES
jgi:thiamine transport system ATP-binding protein